MTSEELAKKTNEAIILWATGKDKLIVAIDGVAGVGKTTLLNNLVKLNSDIIAVNLDDFLMARKIFNDKLLNSQDKSKIFELGIFDNKKIEDFIISFQTINTPIEIDTYNHVSGEINIPKTFDFSKKIMVFDGIFTLHPQISFTKFFNKKIYLKGNLDKINKRRVKREKEKWGKDYFPETHPDSFVRQIIIAFERYTDLYNPEKIADLVLEVD